MYPRTNADKRRAVMALLNDAEWAKWSDREIARRCAVGAPLVGRLRPDVTVTNYSDDSAPHHPPTERTYTDKHGNESVMDTTGIGQRVADEIQLSGL
jgi:hypothetical protein